MNAVSSVFIPTILITSFVFIQPLTCANLHRLRSTGSNCKGENNTKDAVFILDSSESVGENDFHLMSNFVQDIVTDLDIGVNKVRVAVITYSTRVHHVTMLNQSTSKSNVMSTIQAMIYQPGRRRTHWALYQVNRKILTPFNGDRPDVDDIIIVITHGKSTSQGQTRRYSDIIKSRKDVTVISIGVGDEISQSEIISLATSPEHVYFVSDFEEISSLEPMLKRALCIIKPSSSVSEKTTTVSPTLKSPLSTMLLPLPTIQATQHSSNTHVPLPDSERQLPEKTQKPSFESLRSLGNKDSPKKLDMTTDAFSTIQNTTKTVSDATHKYSSLHSSVQTETQTTYQIPNTHQVNKDTGSEQTHALNRENAVKRLTKQKTPKQLPTPLSFETSTSHRVHIWEKTKMSEIRHTDSAAPDGTEIAEGGHSNHPNVTCVYTKGQLKNATATSQDGCKVIENEDGLCKAHCVEVIVGLGVIAMIGLFVVIKCYRSWRTSRRERINKL